MFNNVATASHTVLPLTGVEDSDFGAYALTALLGASVLLTRKGRRKENLDTD